MEDDATRLVWVTMLAMKDRHGEVMGSVPGLANVARVSVGACRAAIQKFLSPDPDSRTTDYEGRRIEAIQGGWAVLNHATYRDMDSDQDKRKKDAIRQQRARDKKASPALQRDEQESRRDGVTNHPSLPIQISDADADADADNTNTKDTLAQPTVERAHVEPDLFHEFWSLYDKSRGKDRAIKKWATLSMKVRKQIMEALPAYIQSTPDKQYRMDPTTYLNGKHWEDEIVNYKAQAVAQQDNGPEPVYDQAAIDAVTTDEHIKKAWDNAVRLGCAVLP